MLTRLIDGLWYIHPRDWEVMRAECDAKDAEIERLRALLLEARDARWDANRTHGHWLLDVDAACEDDK